MKASKIVALFLKDRKSPHELVRSILQFLKISINLLSESLVKDQLAKIIIDNLFQTKINNQVKKHKLLVRKIITKLIRKIGVA